MSRRTPEPPPPPRSLRERAEAVLREQARGASPTGAEDLKALLQELAVHQAELEIQNEELRQAQVELAHARDRYSELFDFAPIGYLTLDRDGRILEANLMAATLLDAPRQELAGATLARFIAPASQATWHLHRQAVASSGDTHADELELRHAAGPPRIVRVESRAVGPFDHRRMFASFIDVTEAQRATRELEVLRRSLERTVDDQTREIRLMAEAVSHLGEGLVITDDELDWPGPQIVFVNDALCRITGYAREELIGRTPRMLQGTRTERRALNWLKTELAAGRPCRVELVNYRRDGTPFDAELFVTPIFDNTGKRIHFVSIHHDISDRKAVERELRRQVQVYEGVHDIVIATDLDATVTLWNQEASARLGYSAGEAIGRHVGFLYFDEDAAAIDQRVIIPVLANGRHQLELRVRAKTGEPRWLDLRLALLRDAAGEPTGIVGCSHDITDQRRVQEWLARSVDAERLRLARELHDGLGGQVAGLGMLSESLADQLNRAASPLTDRARQLSHLIREMQEQVRFMARGLTPVEDVPDGLVRALQSLTEECAAIHARRCRFVGDATVCIEDNIQAGHLFRIAQEAMTNALQHGRASDIRVDLRREGGNVALEIRDDGVGLAQANRRSRGIGVASMQQRARELGGVLVIDSAPRKGTIVRCVVPASGIDDPGQERRGATPVE